MTSRSLKANVGERAYWKNLTPKTTLRSKSREIFRVNNCSLPMMKMNSRGIIQFLNNIKGIESVKTTYIGRAINLLGIHLLTLEIKQKK